MDDQILSLEHISLSYHTMKGETPALCDLTFSVKTGEFVALVGPSGCGKTTTLRILGGFETPDAGKVLFNGQDITQLPPNKRQLNTVFQKYALFTHMTIAENIAFGLKIKGKSKAYIDDKIKYALKLVNLEGYENRSPALLSGGQQQRIAIARTLLKDNNILIFDDSLSAVDTETDAQIRAALRHEQKDVTTLIISHRVTTLSQADLILVLENGQITQQGTHAELCSQPGLYQRINSIQNALEEELTQAKAAEGVN